MEHQCERRFMKRLIGILCGLTWLVSPALALETTTAEKPNIVIILADDCTHSDLPMYGGQNARTPNLEQLAAEGLVFNRAYLAEAMCQPCRAELYSGLYPMRNGCAWNHSASLPETLSMPHYLGCLLYTSPSPRDRSVSRMPSSA